MSRKAHNTNLWLLFSLIIFFVCQSLKHNIQTVTMSKLLFLFCFFNYFAFFWIIQNYRYLFLFRSINFTICLYCFLFPLIIHVVDSFITETESFMKQWKNENWCKKIAAKRSRVASGNVWKTRRWIKSQKSLPFFLRCFAFFFLSHSLVIGFFIGTQWTKRIFAGCTNKLQSHHSISFQLIEIWSIQFALFN